MFIKHQDDFYKEQAIGILSNPYKKITYNGYNQGKIRIFEDLKKLTAIEITEDIPSPNSGYKYKNTKFGKRLKEKLKQNMNI